MKTQLFKNRNWILAVLVVVLICYAWLNRFIQDDAFISFRYAKNWADGHGLVWNPGEKIEGYTNFLWTVFIGIGIKSGINPILFSTVLGLLFFTVTVIMMYRLSTLIFQSEWIGLLAVFLLGANYTFSAYATGGMETQMQTCFFMVSAVIIFHSIDRSHWKNLELLLLSLLMSMALMTRLDSALFCVVVVPWVSYLIFRSDQSSPKRWMKLFVFTAPCVVIVGIWLIWKLSFYGNLLPNTFYAKVSSATSAKNGLYYIYLFCLSYGLTPFLLLVPIYFQKLWSKNKIMVPMLFLLIIIWVFYIIRVGGDFMEFRFIVPILPFIIMILILMVQTCVKQKSIRFVFFLIILLSSVHHQFRFGRFIRTGNIEPVRMLKHHLYSKDEAWIRIGRILGQAFEDNPEPIIATTACGAIPFYSGLKTVDMLGLNDRWIARNGQIVNVKTGHQKFTTFSYLLEKRVNLVIGHPFLKPVQDTSRTVWFGMLYRHIEDKNKIPSDSKFLEIPVNDEYKLIVYYLIRSPIVDQAIRDNDWITYPVFHEQSLSS